MKPYKLVKEHGDHFEVDDGAGSFKVAKAHLHHGTVERIRQHFDQGGEVAPEGDKGTDPEYLERFGVPLKPSKPSALDADPEYVARFGKSDGTPPEAIAAPTAQPPLPDVPAPAPVAQPTGIPAPGKPPSPPPGFAQGQATEAQGIQAGAEAKAGGMADVAKLQAEQAATLEKMNADSQAQLGQRLQRQEAMFNDMVSTKIDPNRVWHQASTGGKISAAIGLILGGIGAGLTKGPNYALEVMNKAFDRDLEAQKLDMGNRHHLLGQYMQQTRDIQAATHMAKADYLTAAAAKLQSAMSGMSSKEAMAQGAVQLGSLQRAAAGELQAATARELANRQAAAQAPLQMASARLGLQQQQMSVDTQRLQMQAIQALTSGQTAPGSMGAKVDPKVIGFLPEAIQSRLVSLPDGTYATARTPDAAKEVAKTHETTGILRDKLTRYRAILDEHAHGVSSTFSPNDYAAAQALRDSILTDINSLAGLNRFTHEEAQIFSGRVPDITSKQISRGHQTKLDELGKEIDDKVWGVNQTYLNINRRRRPGG